MSLCRSQLLVDDWLDALWKPLTPPTSFHFHSHCAPTSLNTSTSTMNTFRSPSHLLNCCDEAFRCFHFSRRFDWHHLFASALHWALIPFRLQPTWPAQSTSLPPLADVAAPFSARIASASSTSLPASVVFRILNPTFKAQGLSSERT